MFRDIGFRRACLCVQIVSLCLATDFAPAQETGKTGPVGVWDISGEDESEVQWIGTLVLMSSARSGLHGHVDWIGSDGSCGREYISGSFHEGTRTLKLVGKRVVFSDEIARASYRAELSVDGSALDDGKWSDSDPTVPGHWSAKRLSLQ